MNILDKSITADELKTVAAGSFGDLVKAVVDIDRGLVAVDDEMIRKKILDVVRRWITR